MIKRLKFPILLIVSGIALGTLTACVPLVAGAAGGYILNEEGYEVRSPITKD